MIFFTKPLKHDVFAKMRDMLGVKNQVQGRMLKVNQISVFLKNRGTGRLVELNILVNRLSQWNMFTVQIKISFKQFNFLFV